MAGISSKALNGVEENRKGFNGNELQSKEFSDQSGLDFYDFNARTYDQLIGRFIQVDPEVDNFDQGKFSPYHFAENNPVTKSDPTGRCPICPQAFAPALPWIVEGIATAIEALVVVVSANEAGKQIAKAINSPAPIGGEGIITGSPLGVPTGSTYRALHAEANKEDVGDNSNGSQKGKAAPTENEASGRGKNYLKKDDEATGDHHTFLRDKNGDVFKYQEWKLNERNPNKFDPGKRFDGGKPDGSPGTPHVDKKTGKSTPTPHINDPKGGARKPEKDEYPQNSRFKQN